MQTLRTAYLSCWPISICLFLLIGLCSRPLNCIKYNFNKMTVLNRERERQREAPFIQRTYHNICHSHDKCLTLLD